MKKRIISFLLPAPALLLLAGCNADEFADYAQVPITLTTSVGDNGDLTRAGTAVQNSQFDQGETFSVYFADSKATVDNATFKTSDASGNTTCTGTQPYFKAGVSSVTAHAYYPSTVTNATNSFTVEQAQNTDANYKLSDLMYATTTINKPTTATSSTGNLTFTHKLSKIVVSATAGAGVTTIKDVRIVGGYRTINITDGTTCALGSSPSTPNTANDYITMYTGGNANKADCAAIIPPQTINGDFLQIETDKGTATYSLASKEFSGGNTYTLDITVAAVSIDQTTTIKDWTTATNCTITVKTRKAAASLFTKGSTAEVGKVVGADGELYSTVSEALNAGTDAIGIVAYVSGGHGLIIALQDAAPYKLKWLYYIKWIYNYRDEDVTPKLSHDYDVPTLTNKGNISNALADGNSVSGPDCQGRENTAALMNCAVNTPAAEACFNYSPTSSGFAAAGNWFLPSLGEWNLMVKEMTGWWDEDLTEDNNYRLRASETEWFFESVGGTNLIPKQYWSSTEYYEASAWCVGFDDGYAYQYQKSEEHYVRAALAF